MKSSLEFTLIDNENFNENFNWLNKDISSNDLINILFNKDFLNKYNLKQCIVYNYDSLEFGNVENIKLDIDNIMEARFFNNSCELSLYRSDDEFKGVFIKGTEETENVIQEDRFIDYRGRVINGDFIKIRVNKYIDYDEDGQAFISYIKPCKFIGGDK